MNFKKIADTSFKRKSSYNPATKPANVSCYLVESFLKSHTVFKKQEQVAQFTVRKIVQVR